MKMPLWGEQCKLLRVRVLACACVSVRLYVFVCVCLSLCVCVCVFVCMYAKLIDNFSHESDVTSLKTPF